MTGGGKVFIFSTCSLSMPVLAAELRRRWSTVDQATNEKYITLAREGKEKHKKEQATREETEKKKAAKKAAAKLKDPNTSKKPIRA